MDKREQMDLSLPERRKLMEKQAEEMGAYYWQKPDEMPDCQYRENLMRHPIMIEIHELCQAIEACGASEQLTAAVTRASALSKSIATLLDERDALADMVGE